MCILHFRQQRHSLEERYTPRDPQAPNAVCTSFAPFNMVQYSNVTGSVIIMSVITSVIRFQICFCFCHSQFSKSKSIQILISSMFFRLSFHQAPSVQMRRPLFVDVPQLLIWICWPHLLCLRSFMMM